MNREQIEMIVWHYEPMNTTPAQVLDEDAIQHLFEKQAREAALKRAGFEMDYDEDGPCGWTHAKMDYEEEQEIKTTIDEKVDLLDCRDRDWWLSLIHI